MELESYHFFYAYNFEVASRCLEVLWASVYAMLETMMVMKLKTKWFCIEIPLCEVVELCGF
jgi:hypothetical protein